MSRFVMLGAGMMGSSLCVPLVDQGHEVRLVGTHLDDTIIGELKRSGVHPTLRVELPGSLTSFFHQELDKAMHGVQVIGVGVSSAGVGWAGRTLAPYVHPEVPIVMISKGLALSDKAVRILPDRLRDEFPSRVRREVQPAAVGGPCIAGELARRTPTVAVLTSRRRDIMMRLMPLLATDYYHLRPSLDVVGVEVCAALKNAYALGVALAWGLHERHGGCPGSVAMHNTESALFAQAIVEMKRLVSLCGGDPSTAAGLPGAGDLFVTCNAGRTGRFGRLLGLGLSRDEAVAAMGGATLESLEILQVARSALALFESRGLLGGTELPLLRHLAEIALDAAPVRLPLERFFAEAQLEHNGKV